MKREGVAWLWLQGQRGKERPRKAEGPARGCRERKRILQSNQSGNNKDTLRICCSLTQAPFQAFLCINSGTVPKPISAHSFVQM